MDYRRLVSAKRLRLFQSKINNQTYKIDDVSKYDVYEVLEKVKNI